MKLFATTASSELAAEVTTILGVPLAKSEVIRFDNSECRVRIIEPVAGEICMVLGSSSNPTDAHLMELFFFADALAREEATNIHALIPYFGYARQNIQHRPGEAVSANVIIRFLETVGYDEVSTFELHDEATAGVFTIPFTALSAFPVLAQEAKTFVKDASEVIVVSPDQGGVERARLFGKFFYEHDAFDIGVVEKKRDQETIHSSQALAVYGDVKGKTVVLVDDVATSGGTLINAAILCKERGATRVIAAVTHHDFSSQAPKALQDSVIDTFITTNSIQLRPEDTFEKLHEVSIASLIAQHIKELSV